jgi:hypothetical protein
MESNVSVAHRFDALGMTRAHRADHWRALWAAAALAGLALLVGACATGGVGPSERPTPVTTANRFFRLSDDWGGESAPEGLNFAALAFATTREARTDFAAHRADLEAVGRRVDVPAVADEAAAVIAGNERFSFVGLLLRDGAVVHSWSALGEPDAALVVLVGIAEKVFTLGAATPPADAGRLARLPRPDQLPPGYALASEREGAWQPPNDTGATARRPSERQHSPTTGAGGGRKATVRHADCRPASPSCRARSSWG